jgi:hypothetical protein
MPAKSQAQRAFIYQKFGKAFAEKHHFDNPGKLPKHAASPKASQHKRQSKGKK